jgi:hypothetical protein
MQNLLIGNAGEVRQAGKCECVMVEEGRGGGQQFYRFILSA